MLEYMLLVGLQIYVTKIRAEQESAIPTTAEINRFYDPAVCSNSDLKVKLESTWLKVTFQAFHRPVTCFHIVISCSRHSQHRYYTLHLFHRKKIVSRSFWINRFVIPKVQSVMWMWAFNLFLLLNLRNFKLFFLQIYVSIKTKNKVKILFFRLGITCGL